MRIILITLALLIASCDAKNKDYRSEYDSILKRQEFITDSLRKKNRERGYGVDEQKPIVSNSKGGKEQATKAIIDEPKIIDAVITDANILYASVYDDGTRRDGYASYLCEVLGDYSTSVNRVKIVKAYSSKDPNADNAYGVLLGECYCK